MVAFISVPVDLEQGDDRLILAFAWMCVVEHGSDPGKIYSYIRGMLADEYAGPHYYDDIVVAVTAGRLPKGLYWV